MDFRKLLHTATAIRRGASVSKAIRLHYTDGVSLEEGRAVIGRLLERHRLDDDRESVLQMWGEGSAWPPLVQLHAAAAQVMSEHLEVRCTALKFADGARW